MKTTRSSMPISNLMIGIVVGAHFCTKLLYLLGDSTRKFTKKEASDNNYQKIKAKTTNHKLVFIYIIYSKNSHTKKLAIRIIKRKKQNPTTTCSLPVYHTRNHDLRCAGSIMKTIASTLRCNELVPVIGPKCLEKKFMFYIPASLLKHDQAVLRID